MLSVRKARPDSRLRSFIRAYVQRETRGVGLEYVEPVVARLGATLEFQFADPIQVPIYGVELPNPSVPITVIGPITRRGARMVMQGHVEALTILFEPLGFHDLFGTPVMLLTDLGTDGHAVLGRPVSTLYERLGNADSFEERVELLDRFFLRQLVTMVGMDVVDHVLNRLASAEGVMRVRDAAAHAGVSTRFIEREALKRAGVQPKLLAMIARFQNAVRIRLADPSSWTRTAHDSGYHDQMHLIRDFHTFAGGAPTLAMVRIHPEHLVAQV